LSKKNGMKKFTKKHQTIIKNYFQTQPVERAYLFGSFVRGEARFKSDLDILVDLDVTQYVGLRFIAMQTDLEALLSQKVDLVASDGLSPFVKPFIDAEKKLIYERRTRG
jgi:uncharacterized protein